MHISLLISIFFRPTTTFLRASSTTGSSLVTFFKQLLFSPADDGRLPNGCPLVNRAIAQGNFSDRFQRGFQYGSRRIRLVFSLVIKYIFLSSPAISVHFILNICICYDHGESQLSCHHPPKPGKSVSGKIST